MCCRKRWTMQRFICASFSLLSPLSAYKISALPPCTLYYGLAAPVIKVCSRSEMKKQRPDIMDYDADPAAFNKATIGEQDEELIRYIPDVAGGRRQPCSEQYRCHNDICIFNPAPIN